MNYTFDPRRSASTQLGALGMTGGNMADRTTGGNMAGEGGPSVIEALLLGAGGRNPFDPRLGYTGGETGMTGGNMANPPGPPTDLGTRGRPRRDFPVGRKPKVGRSLPGVNLPTVFNPGMLDPSKLGNPNAREVGVGSFPTPKPPGWENLPGLERPGEKPKPLGGHLTNF